MKKSSVQLTVIPESNSEEDFSVEICDLNQTEGTLEQKDAGSQHFGSLGYREVSRQCRYHQKKADLLCLNDFAVVCTDCAIFGAHKNHEMKSLDEVQRDRRSRESDIHRVLEECQYTLTLLENDEYSRKTLRQHYESAKDRLKLNFALFKELVDAIETKTTKELEMIYKEQVSQLKGIYHVDRELASKYYFWKTKSAEEMATLNNSCHSTVSISRRLYTESEEVLQGGFDLLTELERQRTVQSRRSALLLTAFDINFDYTCLDPLEGFAKLGSKYEPLLDHIDDWSSITGDSQSATTNYYSSQCYFSYINTAQLPSEEDFEVIETKDDLTTATDLDISLLSIKTAPNTRKPKKLKLPEKYDTIFGLLQKDKLDALDLTNAELGDDTLVNFCEELPQTKVRNIKLIRNKLTDKGLKRLIPSLRNAIVLNLSQNGLTEYSIDLLITSLRELPQLRTVILSQNRIKERSVREKLKQFTARGICVSL